MMVFNVPYDSRTLLITTLITYVVWGVIFLLRATWLKNFKREYVFYALNFFLLYILLIATAVAFDKQIEYQLSQFDTNHDGIFSPAEQTPEQQIYFDLSINDLGRSIVPITGLIDSFISTFLLFLIFRFLNPREGTRAVP